MKFIYNINKYIYIVKKIQENMYVTNDNHVYTSIYI